MNKLAIFHSRGWLLAASLALAACGGGGGSGGGNNGGGDGPSVTGFSAPDGISGVARNALNSGSLDGISVEIYDSADLTATGSAIAANAPAPSPKFTGTTDADGRFTTGQLNCSGYPVIRFKALGFSPVEYQYNEEPPANPVPGQPIQVEPARIPTTAEATGLVTIGGTVKNALTGDGVSGATLKLRRGMNVKSGSVLHTATSGSGGSYAIANVQAGIYTAQVTASIGGEAAITSYTTVYAIAGTGAAYDAVNQNNNITITPPLSQNEWRIVLEWGEHPVDIDSHLWAPAAGNDVATCSSWESDKHIYYSHKSDAADTLNLDVDDTSSYGPETITIRSQVAGTYHYSVHHYTGSKSIAESGATVKVYKGSTLRATYYAPTNGTGYIWDVFSLNGDALTPVNHFRTGALASPPQCPGA